jgi:DNA-binding CsgD family transcriptional regulator
MFDVSFQDFFLETYATSFHGHQPQLLFDDQHDRWFAVETAWGPTGHLNVAISETADPTGFWGIYDFNLGSNRFAEAVSLASAAGASADRLGSKMLADRAETLLRMARGHASDDEPWRPLTTREFEVARLIGEGLTNAEIADTLGIAPKTASSHVEHILAKLGASRRAEIATWASHVQARPIGSRGQLVEQPARA